MENDEIIIPLAEVSFKYIRGEDRILCVVDPKTEEQRYLKEEKRHL